MICGAIRSLTTIVAEQVPVLPQSSVANHVLVVLYVLGHDPAAVTSENVSVGVRSQLSVTDGGENTGVPGHATGVVCATQLTTGPVASVTVTVDEQVL